MLGLDKIDKKYQIGILILAAVVLVVTGIRMIPQSANSAASSSQGIAVFCTNPECSYQGSLSTPELWKIMQDTNAKLQYADQVPPFGMAMMMGWGSEEGPLLCPKCNDASLTIKQKTEKEGE